MVDGIFLITHARIFFGMFSHNEHTNSNAQVRMNIRGGKKPRSGNDIEIEIGKEREK